jgi:hypothetical protein
MSERRDESAAGIAETGRAGHDIASRRRRWRDFLAPRAPGGFMFFIRYRGPEFRELKWPHRWPSKAKERVEFAVRRYEIARAQAEWLHDDFVPYLDNLTGTEIFGEAFGCPVERPDHTMPFSRPVVHAPAEADRVPEPRVEDTPLAYLFDLADEMRRRAGPDAPLTLVDMQSPMGITAEIWEKGDLFCSMIDAPEAVKSVAAKVKRLLIAFHDRWLERYGRAFVAHCPDYPMDGGITLSEDEVGSVNADLFEEFFLQDLVDLSNRYGGIGIHCCACARHQWRHFARVPNLRLLNLSGQATKKTDPAYLDDAYRFFGPRTAQMHESFRPDELKDGLPCASPGSRIVYQVEVETKDEALRACDRMLQARSATAR